MFTVRRSVVTAWLDFLRQNHPKYADLEIDHAALAALPVDGDAMHDLPTQIEEQSLRKNLDILRDEDRVLALRTRMTSSNLETWRYRAYWRSRATSPPSASG
ncbi:hypothetical protein E4U19_004309 [Claviceps sp. Clav32 group G5]|nr:hypothetical protein E4U19_004309 [Claviceps sp. Clav32 group G5]